MEQDLAYEELRPFHERAMKLEQHEWEELRKYYHPLRVPKGDHW